FAGSDQAPSTLQRSQIEKGPIDDNKQDVTSADDGKVNVIPVAIGAIAIIVHLPNACADYTTGGGAHIVRDRPTMTNSALERLWDGDPSFQKWGDVFPWLHNVTNCDVQIHRVVRQESSGTSFALKQFLGEINPAAGWNAVTQGNLDWPNSNTDA